MQPPRSSARSTSWLAALAALLLSLACQAATPAAQPPKADTAPTPAAQHREAPPSPAAAPAADTEGYDLGRDEARGGHTLARHVGKSDADLRERLRREQISAASTYTNRATAERVVARTLTRQRAKLDQWLARQGSRPNLALDYRGDSREPIGRSITRRSPQPVPCTNAVVVLRSTGGRGFIVLTSYPEVAR